MTQADKKLLRSRFLEIRSSIPKARKDAYDAFLCRRVSETNAFRDASSLLLYYPIGSEPDLLSLAEQALAQGIPVGFPRCRDGVMRFYAVPSLDEKNFETGDYLNIPEPLELGSELIPDARTLCIVPALSFDPDGCRLGYGGGYYDRYLASHDPISIGCAYPELRSDLSLHILPTDLCVDTVIWAEPSV
ncbi:MAG: 5-formyltetrahydrofolate cyclo-ligase [Clostridia bacterium]|nr:5-formyltetrahydrofolate cyclo-ligase [Clostridia bacterium]